MLCGHADNEIEDVGAQALADVLEVNKCLRVLNVYGRCNGGVRGWVGGSHKLGWNKVLVSHGWICGGDSGVIALGQMDRAPKHTKACLKSPVLLKNIQLLHTGIHSYLLYLLNPCLRLNPPPKYPI